MFKFFRKYNKWILAIGVSLLMVAFLIQGTLSMFQHSRRRIVIGRINGQKVTMAQLDTARAELDILERLRLLPLPVERNDALAWLLAGLDAHRLGLDVSDRELYQLLGALGLDQTGLRQVSQRLGVSPAFIQQAIRRWILIQHYQDLTHGLRSTSTVQRFINTLRAMQLLQKARELEQKLAESAAAGQIPSEDREQFLNTLAQALQLQRTWSPAARLSRAALERLLYDWHASVRIRLAPLEARRLADPNTPVEPRLLEELFQQYRDNLPGTGKPYGFGYRYPDRVRIEYLVLPFDRVLATVRITEADALEYYQTRLNEFAAPSDATGSSVSASQNPTPPPYSQVRHQVIQTLKTRRAHELAQRIMKEAQGLLLDDARRLPESGGYRLVPDDWQPMPLSALAQELQKRFGILPDVVRLDSQWLDRPALAALPGIGQAELETSSTQFKPIPFPDYALSARELIAPGEENPHFALRLQKALPSLPLIDAQNTRYLFRLIAAEAEHSPASLEEVRPQLEQDARALTAYRRLLLAQQDTYLEKLRQQGLDQLAQELGLPIFRSEPFPRRVLGQQSLEVPTIPGLPPDQSFADQNFVDRIFELAESLASEGNLETIPPARRSLVIPVDQRLTLYLVVLENFQPLRRSDLDRLWTSIPQLHALTLYVLSEGTTFQPLSSQILKARLGYVEEIPFAPRSSSGTSSTPPSAPAKSSN